MAIEAELADGRILEFPDGTDPSVIQATVKRVLASGQPTTMLGGAKELFKGLAPGAVGLLESAATGASALLPEDMEKSAREKIKSVATAAKAPFTAAPGYEESIPRKLSEALGSTAPFLLAGPFGLAGRAVAAGLGVGAGAGEARTRAEEAGATGEQRSTATALGTIPGAFEVFAPFRILGRLPDAVKADGVALARRALQAGGEEAAQEALSGYAQNLIAKGVYKPEQELIEGLGEQAAYGGAVGAIVQGLLDLAIGRRARGAAPAPTEEQPAAPGPQLAPEAPAGTQGTLFTPEEMGKPVPAPKEPKEPPAAGVPEGQQDLGLDFQREYADMATERERLRQQPQTPEAKARIAELTEQMKLYTQSDIESIRAEKELADAAAAEDAATRKKFPALANAPDLLTQPDEVKARTQGELFPDEDLGTPPAEPSAGVAEPTLRSAKEKAPLQYKLPLRTVPEGREPKRNLTIPARPGELTLQDVQNVGVPLRVGMQPWFEQNVVGKTVPELQQLVKRQPELVKGQSPRAKILRELLAPQPAPFEEKPSEPTIAPTPAVEQRNEPRVGEPSVGVPSEPAAPIVPEPGAGAPVAAEAPATPDGRGLVSAGRPAVPGAEPQRAEPVAVTPKAPAKAKPAKPVAAPAAPAVEVEAVDEEAARKAEAEDMKRRLEALEKAQRPTPAAAKPAAPAPKKAEPSKPIPEKMYEPTGTSEFGMEEGQKEILRGPQAMLFPMTKKEEIEYAEREKPEAEAEAEPTTVKDERQGELDLRPPRKAAAKVPAKKAASAQPTAVAPTTDVIRTADAWGGTVEFFDGTVGIIKRPHPTNGEIQYIPIRADGTYSRNLFGIQSVDALQALGSSKIFSPAEMSALVAQTADLKARETAAEAKFPDGPFTGATSNVVAGKSVDPRYTNYLTDLMRSMGLGDVRVFLYHSADVAGNENKLHLHGSYYPIMARGVTKDSQKGGTRPIGPDSKDFMLFIKDGMSETETLEILSHELGHMIQKIAYDTAPANVQTEIKNAYDDWLASLKGKTVEDLVRSLRNRAAAEMTIRESGPDIMQRPISTLTAKDQNYWMGFSEWFADNVSRWATTADKPLTVTEKFFSKVAQMMRDLVTVVTGRKYPPQKTVADFLNKMGPGSADLWMAKNAAPGAQAVQPMRAAPDTPKFNKWFGDSKVVDENGKPLVMYHGTKMHDEYVDEDGQAFNQFAGSPNWFAVEPYTASGYAGATGSMYPVYLSIKKPLRLQFDANDDAPPAIAAAKKLGVDTSQFNPDDSAFVVVNSASFIEAAQQAGFDGIEINEGGYKTFAAFDPRQIKSATGNTGAYSESPEIHNAMTFSKNYTAEDVVDRMGDLTPIDKRGVLGMFKGAQDSEREAAEPGRGVKFRVAVADSAAAIEDKLSGHFNGAVRDSLGKLNPMGLYRQAQDYSKLLLAYFQEGSLQKEKETGQYKVVKAKDGGAPADVFPLIYAWGDRTGRSKERAEQFASRVIEAYRLEQVLKANPDFPKHIKDADRALLVAEYNADPAFAEMSAAMDKPRVALVDQMVKVGRLSKEQGDEWKSVIGYVPFDRIDDFAERFTAVKKTTGRSPLMLTKNPELKGSFTRPVGNVFENYLNTMGWMVGQVMTNDARVQTLRTLEDLGFTGTPSRMPGTKHRTAKAYVGGELMYWDLPSSYDVAAFQELNPPKAKWLQVLGQVSNVLRKSVTILPPFALKQVTDDVQRAIMTSGVKNPGALLRMTLSNFGGLALAELRGIRHPTVSEMEGLGLTGEFDFQQGKPAVSLLKDLGHRPRGKFETLMHRLEGITRASDLAVRKAIYDQTIKESQDQLLAQTRAREFINFRRRGSSEFVGAMVTTIPFFNAYIQGMDVLYRAASGKDSSASVGRAQARRMFYSRAAIAMTLSTLYALGKGDDDEEYNEMDLRTRDSNWILPGGFKLPVPTELGALFKVVPERIVEYMRRQGTPEEQEAWEATRTALAYIFEQYVGRVVPIPQAAKPLLEAWTNYSFFTGRELEGIYQKQQDPSMRRASNTSELAIAISAFSRDVVGVDKISPIMIDNALSGYFGSTAGLLVAMTDSLLNPTRVDRPLHKYALLSNYLYDPVGTRRMTEFYDDREKVGRANATLAELMKTDIDRAVAYAEKNADVLMMESSINSTLEQLERTRAYRKFLNSKDGAEMMPAEEREAELKEIKKMEIEMTGWLREAKALIRQ